MAIDTAEKRAAAFIDDCGILFPPDGAIDSFDREWMLGQYPFSIPTDFVRLINESVTYPTIKDESYI